MYHFPVEFSFENLKLIGSMVFLQAHALNISDLKPFFDSTEFSSAHFELDEVRGIIRHRLTSSD